ncbi:MAG: 5'/3'-nucleotidase SurE [Clostridium sp.]|nr:5'/3'-nucleotidase SurE [Clostridium sp.]
MNGKRPLILVTNDDGYTAAGICALTRIACRYGDVVVVAPDGPRSGASCSITVQVPVYVNLIKEEEGLKVFACTGRPVDCVKLGLECCVPRRPDLLLSGINHGSNASVNIHYSGTMGAVWEGCMKGIPSVGFSLDTFRKDADFSPLEEAVGRVIAHVLSAGLPQDVCLNINFPETDVIRGLRVARMGRGAWGNEWMRAEHPRGGHYYWLTGDYINLEPEAPDTDIRVMAEGYGAVTPVQVDMTAYEALASLKTLEG